MTLVLEAPTPAQTTEVLIQAYTIACLPTPFHATRGDHQMAELLRNRVASVGFSPYWGRKFMDFRDKYNGNPAGYFAREIFRAAEHQEGHELLITVAFQLGDKFGDDVLKAEFDTPFLDEPVEPAPLAKFLIIRRRELQGSSIPLYPRPPIISHAWIRASHYLATDDPERHGTVLREIELNFNSADIESDELIEEYAGHMGGYSIFDKIHNIESCLASTLSRHFPQRVVAELTDPKETVIIRTS